MSALSVLRCDHEGCDGTYIRPGMSAWLRQSAESIEGWHCSEDGDFCPVHIPAVSEFSSAA